MIRPLLRAMPLSVVIICLTALVGISSATVRPAAAQDHPPCVTDVVAEMLGNTLPDDAGGLALVSVRLTIGPGGGFDAHTHPGTLVVSVDSGALAFTQLDHGDMTLNRAAVDGTPTASETIVPDQEVTLNAGDWFVEPGDMVHMAWNRTGEPTVVLLAGLVAPDQPLVQCVDADSV